MDKQEHILAAMLLMISTVIKIWSVIVLYSVYAHTEEILNDNEYKAKIKKPKTDTHQPLK